MEYSVACNYANTNSLRDPALLQAFTEDFFIFSFLVYIAH